MCVCARACVRACMRACCYVGRCGCGSGIYVSMRVCVYSLNDVNMNLILNYNTPHLLRRQLVLRKLDYSWSQM